MAHLPRFHGDEVVSNVRRPVVNRVCLGFLRGEL